MYKRCWLIALFTLVACSKTYYVRPGATPTDFEVDKSHCETRASLAAGYGTFTPEQQIANALVHGRSLMDECLRAKGWRPTTAEELNAAGAKEVSIPAPPPQAADDYKNDPTCRRPQGLPCGTP